MNRLSTMHGSWSTYIARVDAALCPLTGMHACATDASDVHALTFGVVASGVRIKGAPP